MSKDKEKKILEEAVSLKSGVSVDLFNHYSKMKMVKNDMVNALDLLDEVAEGNKKKKDVLRKKILDSYNELPRTTLSFIEEVTKKLK